MSKVVFDQEEQPDGATKTVPLMEHQYSDTLLITLLKAHRPEKYRDRVDLKHGGTIRAGENVSPAIERVMAEIRAIRKRAGNGVAGDP